MSPSAGLTEAAREIVRLVRPELNQRQVKAAANVIAADVRPDATTVDPEDVRRAQAAVEDAIVRQQPTGARAALQ
jgi:hypothetical protein